MEKLFDKIEKYIIYLTIFLFPIFLLPISPNPFVVSKLVVLVIGVSLALLVKAIKVIYAGRLEFMTSKYDLPVFLLGFSFLLSTLLRTPNKMEALLLPGTATVVIGGAILYYLLNQLKEDDKKLATNVLFASSTIFAVFILLSFSGVFAKLPQLPAFLKIPGFTPEGGFLPAAIFLGVLLPVGLGLFLSARELNKKAVVAVSLLVICLALSISIYNLIPGRPNSPRFPSFMASWSIAVDSLKESPLLGVGPGNYLSAFNRFRPLTYNNSDLWAVKFATANSFYLTSFTETGMLGAAALIILIFTFYKTTKQEIKERKIVNWGFASTATSISQVILLAALVFFPATVLIIALFFILFALSSQTHKTYLNLTTEAAPGTTELKRSVAQKLPALLVTTPIIIAVLLVLVNGGRVVLGEYTFNQALTSLARNDAAKTYDAMRQAIRINPYVDRYHATFTRVNLALANSILQRVVQAKEAAPSPEKGSEVKPAQISDQDRQTITTLVQQAISEGKATVALNPLRSGNWEVLAQVYRSVTPLAQGADVFAAQTYRQAVALDPINPNLRIALGGIHFGRRDFETAVKIFELAASAKPDLANAHYNLAFALREKGDLDRAIAEMTLVLSLIQDKQGQDYMLASSALEDMQAKKSEEAKSGNELTAPKGEQGPQIQPPLNLPEGSEPPQVPITPTPTGSETAGPTPTPTPLP